MRLFFREFGPEDSFPEKGSAGTEKYESVYDEDTGNIVGHAERDPNVTPRTTTISLFGGRYRGAFKDRQQCIAFTSGVETVLNRHHVLRFYLRHDPRRWLRRILVRR